MQHWSKEDNSLMPTKQGARGGERCFVGEIRSADTPSGRITAVKAVILFEGILSKEPPPPSPLRWGNQIFTGQKLLLFLAHNPRPSPPPQHLWAGASPAHRFWIVSPVGEPERDRFAESRLQQLRPLECKFQRGRPFPCRFIPRQPLARRPLPCTVASGPPQAHQFGQRRAQRGGSDRH